MAAPGAMMSQPGAVVVQQVTSAQRSDTWNSGICDCFDDMGICCCGTFCLPCLACQTATDMGESCCLPWLLPGTGEIAMRTAIRERYGIRGNILDDASMLCWCHCCTLCQMAREVRVRKNMINVHTSTTTAYAPVSQY